MSIQYLNWSLSRDEIETSGAKFVLVVLANYANEDGEAYPSRETIGRLTSMSVRAVQNHLNWLVENGYLARKSRRQTDQQFKTNLYQLRPSAESAQGTEIHVQISTEPCADFDKKPCADSAPYTKALKDEPSGLKKTIIKTRAREGGDDDGILKYYSVKTKNRISQTDRDAMAEIEDIDPAVCKIGILLAIDRAQDRIRSFNYCCRVIRDVSKTAVQNPGLYLKFLESNKGSELVEARNPHL